MFLEEEDVDKRNDEQEEPIIPIEDFDDVGEDEQDEGHDTQNTGNIVPPKVKKSKNDNKSSNNEENSSEDEDSSNTSNDEELDNDEEPNSTDENEEDNDENSEGEPSSNSQRSPEQIKNDMQNLSDKLDAKNNAETSGKGKDKKENNTSQNNTETPANNSTGRSPNSTQSTNTTTPASQTTPQPVPQSAPQTPPPAAQAAQTSGAAGSTASASTAASSAAANGGAAATTAGVGTALSTVLAVAAIVILILIIVIGAIFFLEAMPGQVTQKFKKMGLDFIDAFQALIRGSENVVHTEDLAGVANYLESMGYDLKGEGFVSSEKPTISSTIDSAIRANAYYDDEQDVWRDGDTGDVLDLNSDPIMTYVVSDNLCYIIKNFNQNLEAATGGHGSAAFGWIAAIIAVLGAALAVLFSPIAAIVALVATVAGSTLAFATASNPNWGTGLISIWHEGERFGEKGEPYDAIERGFIELDAKSKQLKVKRGWTNEAYTFDVEGWSGRYGMPLEFLLSVHVATHMPDLPIEMATTFDTDVEILLHSIDDGSVTAGFRTDSGIYIDWPTMKDILNDDNNVFEDIWNGIIGAGDNSWFSLWNGDAHLALSFTDRAYYRLYEIGMQHADDCQCCSHIPGAAGTDGQDCDTCTIGADEFKDNGSFEEPKHDIGASCKQLVQKVASALRIIQDNHWYSYTPYISKVTNHWFRDVYFIIDNPASTNVIEVDEDYFYETNERWTTYETYSDGDSIPEGFEVGDYKLYEYNSGTYTLSTKTKKEVEELNQKIASGDTSVTKLVKKPISNLVSANDGSRWIAYELVDGGESGWQLLETSENSPELLEDPDLRGKLYYKERRPDDVKQIEDGQRTETNETIKTMFVNKAYYQYDGTVERANRIEEDRQNTNRANDNTASDERDKTLISKVSLARDSLGAFSILENTHTMDADYIYRDFKELIVELDYFDKEDLSDKIADVMQWPIPDCGSAGWPIRKYEKGDTFYGTLINSMVDLELMINADVEAATELLSQLESEIPAEGGPVGGSSGVTPSISINQFVQVGYDVHEVMEGNNWDYCVLTAGGGEPHMNGTCPDRSAGRTCSLQHCDTYSDPGSHVCGLNNTIQEAEAGFHNTCCSTYVSWVLKEAGFDYPDRHDVMSVYNWADEQGWADITDYSQLKAGDLLFNHGSVGNLGHVQMLGNSGEWLNAGSISAINGAPRAYTADFIIGKRPNLKGAAKPFEGYKPNQDVVAPVTGKITEYGTVDRVNEETGETETVEFIKIEAMHNYMTSDKGEGYKACNDIEDIFEEKASAEAKRLEGYDYFYEEYQGILDGFVLYIEGFDLTLFDGDGAIAALASDPENTEFARYEANEVYNMVDDLKEARAIWREDAKALAAPILQVGSDYYIKEGTVIGKTYEDPDMTGIEIVSRTNTAGETVNSCYGNGNYMRLILRDLEDAIVEDVESYIRVDEQVQNLELEKFLYWLGICLENGYLEERGGVWYSVSDDLGDGAGATHFFGLTGSNLGLAQSLGYSISEWGAEIELEILVDVFLARIEQQKEYIEEQLGSGMDDGYLYAFQSVLYNYGNLTVRGDEYKSTGSVSESTWCTYEGGGVYASALTERRIAEWALITEGRFEDASHTEIDFTAGGKYSEATPFTDWCAEHGINISLDNFD